jgi:hypothetical protein
MPDFEDRRPRRARSRVDDTPPPVAHSRVRAQLEESSGGVGASWCGLGLQGKKSGLEVGSI